MIYAAPIAPGKLCDWAFERLVPIIVHDIVCPALHRWQAVFCACE
jgi:hypothetical protein